MSSPAVHWVVASERSPLPPPRTREEAIRYLRDGVTVAQLQRRLVLFALSRMPRQLKSLPDAQDLAQDAIAETLGGLVEGRGRQWDPVKHPDPFLYLSSVITSLKSNEITSLRFQREQLWDGPEDEEPDAPASGPGVDDVVRKRRKYRHGLARLAEVRARLTQKSDALGLRVLDALEEGVIEPARIADELGVPVADVYHARTRMKGHLDAVLEADPDSSGPMKAAALSSPESEGGT